MFNTDAPIAKPEEDLLGRLPFAKNLAKAVLSYREPRSIAIGLYGAWGDGKTSLLNLVLAEIENTTSESSDAKPPIVVRFNPWNFSTQEQLISQFFKQLSLKLKMSNVGATVKGVGEKLETLSKVLIPAKFIPGAGELVEAMREAINQTSEATKAAGAAIEKDIARMKDAIDAELAKLNRKIIITVDDIDRLTDIEIRQVFQLVKSLGDFKNTIYFLLFDRSVVANALDTAQRGNGMNYLEKIIQVPFELPSPTAEQILDLVLKKMTTVIQNVENSKWDSQYWGNIFHSGFKYHFRNLRDSDRYLSVFSFNFGLMGTELNPVDLAAMTGLQIFQPKLHSAIRENQALFLGDRSFGRANENQRKQLKDECDEISKLATGPFSDHALDHVMKLFPQLEEYYKNTTYGSLVWRKAGRVCSSSHFTKFFSLVVPQGDIPKAEIEQLISAAKSEDKFRSELLTLGKRGLFHKTLDHLQDYTEEDIPIEHVPNVIKVVLDVGDQFLERHGNAFFSMEFDTSILVLRVVYQLLNRYKPHSVRAKVFSAATKPVMNSAYTIAHQVAVMGQEFAKYGGNPETLDQCTVLKDDLVKFKRMSAQKIQQLSKREGFFSHPKLAALLSSWREWGKAAECDKFVRSKVKEDANFIELLKAFTGKSYQTGLSDYTSKVIYSADPQSLKHWITPEKLKKRLAEITSSDDYASLDDGTKRAVTAFTEGFEKKDRFRL